MEAKDEVSHSEGELSTGAHTRGQRTGPAQEREWGTVPRRHVSEYAEQPQSQSLQRLLSSYLFKKSLCLQRILCEKQPQMLSLKMD